MNWITKNWKTTASIVLTIATSLYQLLSDNATVFGIDNKVIMIIAFAISAVTIIVNGATNGTGETATSKFFSYFK